MKERFINFGREMKKNRVLFLMVLPAVLLVLVLSYLPMSGLILAFKNYRFDKGVFGSDWNGLENFRYLFSSGTGWLITKNTILYNLLNLITSQGLAIVLAIIISEMQGKIYKKVTQSIIFLPYFISWVIVGAFVYNIFNYETGLMNGWLTALGMEKVNVYSMPWVWPIIICCFNAWKWCGYNSIIYIAAITGIDGECYEAAQIDGAGSLQRFVRITLPNLMPTLFTITVLSLLNSFKVFREAYLIAGGYPDDSIYMLQHLFNNWYGNLDVDKMCAGAVMMAILVFILILLMQKIMDRGERI